MDIDEIKDLVMKQAAEKGWGTKVEEINVMEKLALIHSEVSEALQAYRYKKDEEFGMELGDIVTRILHLCGIMNIDIKSEILKKLELNKNREWNWEKMNEGN